MRGVTALARREAHGVAPHAGGARPYRHEAPHAGGDKGNETCRDLDSLAFTVRGYTFTCCERECVAEPGATYLAGGRA